MAAMPDAPLTCLDIWCRAGSSSEKPGEEGLAHFLEHMVFKGSENLLEGEFDRQIEALGGSSNAATGFDDVHYHILVPPNVALPGLELLLNLVLSPSIHHDAFCIEREVVLEEIAQYKDQPDEQVFQKLLESCLAPHAYGRPILGLEESLKKSEPKNLKDFHQRLYKPENICLSIAGQIPKGIENFLSNSYLAELKNITGVNSPDSTSQTLIFNKGRMEIQIPRLEASRLLMAWQIGPAKNQLLTMGADIATSLLAEGRRSRMVSKLRENLQIVESIDMDITVLEQGGLVLLEACCHESNLDLVEKEIHKELSKSMKTNFNKHELDRACQLVKNGLYFSLETTSQVAGLAGNQTLWNRNQSLLKPLKYINYWTESQLKLDIFDLLQPEEGFTLIARPKEV